MSALLFFHRGHICFYFDPKSKTDVVMRERELNNKKQSNRAQIFEIDDVKKFD